MLFVRREFHAKNYRRHPLFLFASREYTEEMGKLTAANNVCHFKLFELFNRCRRDK